MENVNEAIYIGVYTMIFVIALTLTIFLFSSLMSYSDEAYEYMHSIDNNGVLLNAPANRYLVINGQEVISYYFNYIQKDKYLDKDYDEKTVVTINLNSSSESPQYLTQDDLTYKELLEKIGINNKYVLSVDQRTNSEYTYINITKATQEQVQEVW